MEKIPFFGLKREHEAFSKEYVNIFSAVMATGKALQGEEIKSFEETLKNLTRRKFAVAVNSCTDALCYALIVSGIKPGDEVLVTSFSFIASVSCVSRLGAIPVFCDIEEDSYHMSLSSMKKMISPKTKAIVYPHLFGKMTDTKEIEAFARENKLVFIEDAAQSLGSTFKNMPAGSIGDFSCISFDPTKVIAAPGSGGVFLTNDEKSFNIVKKLRYHGKGTENDFELLGFNSQMPSLSAGILNFKLSKLKAWETARQAVAKKYNESFLLLKNIIPESTNHTNHIYHKYVINTGSMTQREKIINALTENNVETMVHYRKTIQDNQLFKSLPFREDHCIKARNLTEKVLSLPIHPWLSDREVNKIIDIVVKNSKEER